MSVRDNRLDTSDDDGDLPRDWPERVMGSLLSRSPRLSRWSQWLHGPGKETSLPHPIPWLQLTFTFQKRTRTFPVERVAIRATRRFTSPYLLAILTVLYIISLTFFARAQVRRHSV